MPQTEVVFYREDDDVPVLAWLEDLLRTDRKAFAKCRARIDLLEQEGHQLRRPVADYLRDGIYELRSRQGTVQHRILYFFHGGHCAVLAHAIVKPGAAVPPKAIDLALARKKKFVQNPKAHTYEEDEADA